ncbi:hypothetical protein PCL1606_15990 [Pseudomonas chlororaphis]|uniref:Uncharacterized protein n=1 Tax=Pseudomonas chlororaphis TaxID=587753 RepID=A0A0D5XWI6_9PSED|nr:hypothetical protein PCL1606_15990 [Pseudomonas chlororaphis]
MAIALIHRGACIAGKPGSYEKLGHTGCRSEACPRWRSP